MRWSACILHWVEDKEVEKTRATFHRKAQHIPSKTKIILFTQTIFWNSALIALLLGIPHMHRNGTWAKLNTRHLGTRIFWLLMDIYFCSFFIAHWRHWWREKTGNGCVMSCVKFLSKPRRQTVVNQVSCGFNPHLNRTFFQFLDLFEALFFALWWHMFWDT